MSRLGYFRHVPESLCFSKDGLTLCSEAYNGPCVRLDLLRPSIPTTLAVVPTAASDLSKGGAWTRYCGHDCLWMPGEYRSSIFRSFRALGSFVVSGSEHGNVTIMEFCESSETLRALKNYAASHPLPVRPVFRRPLD